MKKRLFFTGLFVLVLGIACLTGEIIGCFLTPVDGILYFFGTTSHDTLGFMLHIPQYLIAAGIIILIISAIVKENVRTTSEKNNIGLCNPPKFGTWKKRRTIFQIAVLALIGIHITLTILGLTDIRGVCPRSLGDMATKGELGISAFFWASIIVLSVLWGRVLCGWLCVYAPVQKMLQTH